MKRTLSTRIEDEVTHNLWITSLVLLVFTVSLALIVGILLLRLSESKLIVNCNSFMYQESAQAALPSHAFLDADHDGVACETLPKLHP